MNGHGPNWSLSRKPVMPPKFYFDVVSPNAYLAHRVLPGIEKRTGVSFEYTPISLGSVMQLTNNQPPLVAFAGVRGKIDYIKLEIRRFISKHKITRFKFSPYFPLDTKLAMAGALVAKDHGVLAEYSEVTLAAMWENNKRLSDPATLAEVLSDGHLDADSILRAARTKPYGDALEAASNRAVDRGVFGVPSFLAGDELFFGKDSLADLEECLALG